MKPTPEQIALAKKYVERCGNPHTHVDESGDGPIITTDPYCYKREDGIIIHIGHDDTEPCELDKEHN